MFKEYLKTARPEIVKDGLVLWYQGDDFTNDPVTTSWRDRSGLGNHGTCAGFLNTTASGSNKVGAVNFDAVHDKVTVTGTSLDPTTALQGWTLEIVLSSSMTTRGELMRCFATPTGYVLAMNRDGVGTITGILGTVYVITPNVSINDNAKHHIMFTVANGTQKIFVDGVLVVTATSSIYDINSNGELGIGSYFEAETNLFNGLIYLARIYNRTLTTAEVLQNYSTIKY